MTNVGYATLQVIPSMKGIEGNLSRGLAGPMTSAGTKAGKTLGEHTVKGYGGAVKGIATLATGLGAYFIGSKINQFFKDSISEAREAQKATAQTAAVIKSTGGAANVSAKGVANLANALSLKTGIDDETIQSGENMLLTFKNLRNEAGKGNDIFNQSTKTLVDLSAAMGTEPKQAAIQLGKALNDPIKGITALTRVGVTFTDKQKETIKSLTESGHRLEAQKIILRELNSEFRGSAKAQATAGDKMKVAWQNLEEQVGTALLPTLDKLEGFLTKKAIPKVSKFIGQMQSGKGAGGDFADSLRSVFDAAKGIAGRIGDVIGALNGMPSWAKKLLATGVIGGALAVKLKIPSLVSGGAGLLGKSLGVQKVFVVNEGFGKPGVPGVPSSPGSKVPPIVPAAGGGLLSALGLYLAAPISAAVGGYLIPKLLKGQSESDAKGFVSNSGGGNSGGMGLPTDAGKSLVTDEGSAFSPFPKGFLENLTGGAAQLQKARDLFILLGGTAADFKAQLGGLDKTKVKPEIGADSKPLEGRYHQSKALLDDLGHAKPMSTIGANNKPGLSATAQMMKSLGVVGKQHPTPKVSTSGVPQAIQGVNNLLHSMGLLHDKDITITTHYNKQFGGLAGGGGHEAPHARGGYIVGAGSGTSDSIPARLSNGEFVVNAAATRRNLALLHSINAQRFASGGQVGGGSASGSLTLTEDQFRRLEKVLERGAENGTARGMGALTKRLNVAART